MDDSRLRALMRELYIEGTRQVPPFPSKVTRHRSHRLQLVVASVAVAAAALVAIIVLVPGSSDGPPARLVPIDSSPSVTVPTATPSPAWSLSVNPTPRPPVPGAPTYLPSGTTVRAVSTVKPSGLVVLTYQLPGTNNPPRQAAGVLQVYRFADGHKTADGFDGLILHGLRTKGQKVNGNPATLFYPPNGLGIYAIQWESNGHIFAVTTDRQHQPTGLSGLSLDELRKVAESGPS
jgi:hypothetical protein